MRTHSTLIMQYTVIAHPYLERVGAMNKPAAAGLHKIQFIETAHRVRP